MTVPAKPALDHVRTSMGRYTVCLTESQITRLFGGKQPGKKLGCGRFACAFENPTDPTTVVKITHDPDDIATMIHANEVAPQYVVPLREAFRLVGTDAKGKARRKRQAYAAIVDKLKTVGTSNPADFRNWQNELIFERGDPYICTTRFEGGGGIKPNKKKLAECSALGEKVRTLVEGIDAAGIDWRDLHAGNVGFDGEGNLRVLDLGLTSTGRDKLHLATDLKGVLKSAWITKARKKLKKLVKL